MVASCESRSREASPTISGRSSRPDAILDPPLSASDPFVKNTNMSSDADVFEVDKFKAYLHAQENDLSWLSPFASAPASTPTWCSPSTDQTDTQLHDIASCDGIGANKRSTVHSPLGACRPERRVRREAPRRPRPQRLFICTVR